MDITILLDWAHDAVRTVNISLGLRVIWRIGHDLLGLWAFLFFGLGACVFVLFPLGHILTTLRRRIVIVISLLIRDVNPLHGLDLRGHPRLALDHELTNHKLLRALE